MIITVHAVLRAAICFVPWMFFFVWCRAGNDKGILLDAVLSVCGFAATYLACLHSGGRFTLCLSCAVLTTSMLMASSREDIKKGTFFVVPLYACILGNVLFAVYSARYFPVSGAMSIPFWKETAAVVFVLVALRLGKLATGDCFIYLACWLSFLTLFREYSFFAFFLMLLVSTLIGILSWFVMVIRGMKATARFPFTAQISAGCLVSYAVFGILG